VGPDRRSRPTSFLDRHFLLGRRRTLASGMVGFRETFVDRLSPDVARVAIAYILLSLIDTVFTFRYVAFGSTHELNPLLRVVIRSSPVAFILLKNALSLGALFVVVRYQLVRLGRVVLVGNMLLYALLDFYW